MRELRLFFLAVALLSTSPSLADELYRAYSFADTALENRTDLRKLLPSRDTQINAAIAGELIDVEVRGVRWRMSPEIADFLDRARRSSATEPFAPSAAIAPLLKTAVTLDRATESSVAGQIRVMLKPLTHAGLPNEIAPLFRDADFVSALERLSLTDNPVRTDLTLAQKQKFAMLQGALMWRLRGGGLYIKTSGSQTWRFLFTMLPMRTLGELAGAPHPTAVGGWFWLGLMQSWGRFFDIGRFPAQEDRFFDLARMTQIGSRLTDGLAWDLERQGYDASALRVAGRQFAGCYDYAWEFLAEKRWGDRAVEPFVEIAAVPTQWAEMCAGASFGVALVKTLATKR